MIISLFVKFTIDICTLICYKLSIFDHLSSHYQKVNEKQKPFFKNIEY